MENCIATTIEQSKKLLELGLDINTADMYIQSLPIENSGWTEFYFVRTPYDVKSGVPEFPSLTDGKAEKWPAWSLAKLWIMMPSSILYDKGIVLAVTDSPLTITKYSNGKYLFSYPKMYTVECNSPLDAAFEMICWLLETKRI